jgi:hypothetical protein
MGKTAVSTKRETLMAKLRKMRKFWVQKHRTIPAFAFYEVREDNMLNGEPVTRSYPLTQLASERMSLLEDLGEKPCLQGRVGNCGRRVRRYLIFFVSLMGNDVVMRCLFWQLTDSWPRFPGYCKIQCWVCASREGGKDHSQITLKKRGSSNGPAYHAKKYHSEELAMLEAEDDQELLGKKRHMLALAKKDGWNLDDDHVQWCVSRNKKTPLLLTVQPFLVYWHRTSFTHQRICATTRASLRQVSNG